MLSVKTLTDSKHMFYNVSNRYWNDVSDIGGIYVDEEKRKEELVKMIESIKDADTIKYLHTFIKTFLEEWG